MTIRHGVKGDTIVEVLFATAIGATIIMIAITLMNQNLATIQRGLESTLVRQSVDSQAEQLRYLADQHKATRSSGAGVVFQQLLDNYRIDTANGATTYGQCTPNATNAPKAFYLAADTTVAGVKVVPYDQAKLPDTFASPGEGMWIEAVGPASGNYIDFHIRACWDPPVGSNKSVMGTIARVFYVVGDETITYDGSPLTLNATTLGGDDYATCTPFGNCTAAGDGAVGGNTTFTVKYTPSGLQSKKYILTLNYSNRGGPSAQPPATYKYKVKIDYNGNTSITSELRSDVNTATIDLGDVTNTSSFTISWLNDCWGVNPDGTCWKESDGGTRPAPDANLQINSVKWEGY